MALSNGSSTSNHILLKNVKSEPMLGIKALFDLVKKDSISTSGQKLKPYASKLKTRQFLTMRVINYNAYYPGKQQFLHLKTGKNIKIQTLEIQTVRLPLKICVSQTQVIKLNIEMSEYNIMIQAISGARENDPIASHFEGYESMEMVSCTSIFFLSETTLCINLWSIN